MHLAAIASLYLVHLHQPHLVNKVLFVAIEPAGIYAHHQ